MAIIKDYEKIKKWFYRIDKITLSMEDEDDLEIPTERINEIGIKNDYKNSIFPVFYVKIILEDSVYYKLLEHKDKANVILNLKKFYKYVGTEEESVERDFISGTFQLIIDDNDIDTNNYIEKESASGDYTKISTSDLNELDKVDNEIQLYLFNTDAVNGIRKSVNEAFSGQTVANVIAYLCSEANFDKILMSPPDNTDSMDIFIPPMQIKDALSRIDQYYGIYSTGSMIFVDINHTYILKYHSECTAWESKETKEVDFIVPERPSQAGEDQGTYQDENNDEIMYIVVASTNIHPRNVSISQNALSGSNMLSINAYDGTSTTVQSNAVEDSTNTVVVVNNTENKFFESTYTAKKEAQMNTIEMVITDFDWSYLQPNKQFKIIFEDADYVDKYKGTYQLVYSDTTFLQSGSMFKSTAYIVLEKV